MIEVAQHYAAADIADRILAALRIEHGPDVAITPDILAPIDHFHAGGLAATKEMVTLLKPECGEHLLDIGSGIGGPARWIAEHFGCRISGVDLMHAFCEAARALTFATGQSEQCDFQQGTALSLPFSDSTFDRAYSQNVVMNIADKAGFYREAIRVLRPGGIAAFSNRSAGPKGEPHYPVPWAQSAATSFLSTPVQTEQDLRAAGFEIVYFRDKTADVLPAHIARRQRLESSCLPKLGVHTFLGDRFHEYGINTARSVEGGRLSVIEALVRKPV